MQKTIPNTLTYITGELLGYQKAELIPTQKIWYSENQDTAEIRKTSEKLVKSALESIQGSDYLFTVSSGVSTPLRKGEQVELLGSGDVVLGYGTVKEKNSTTTATITTGVDISLVESLRYLADSVIEPEKINAKVLVEFSKTNKLFLQCDVTAEENNLLIRPFFFTRV